MDIVKKKKLFAEKKFQGFQLDTFRHTKSFFFRKIINYYFSTFMKSLFCCQQNIFHSVKDFRICIRKSFMWPRFFLTTLYCFFVVAMLGKVAIHAQDTYILLGILTYFYGFRDTYVIWGVQEYLLTLGIFKILWEFIYPT